jgi:hypothetical protein
MANPENITKRSRAEAVKNGRKGGVKSGESRRRKRALQDVARAALDGTPSRKIVDAIKKIFPDAPEGMKNDVAMLFSQLAKAILQKDTRAAEFIRDTAGEKPKNDIDIDANLKINIVKKYDVRD